MDEYPDDLTKSRTTKAVLADQVGGFRTLEHILDWMKSEGYTFASLDMVTQDEFCHDLLMPIGDDWLVFGMT